MYANQRREIRSGDRKRIDWNPIAQRCIFQYAKIRSLYQRRVELDRLRDAVYRRQRRLPREKPRR
jgi:hypothetical protein